MLRKHLVPVQRDVAKLLMRAIRLGTFIKIRT